MNCQDISRIADSGQFSKLTEVERRTAEAHALSCRRCAAVWGAHARLAELRIPPMPSELLARCRTLAALPAHARDGYARRRLALVGVLTVLAAAAALLAIHLRSSSTPQSPPIAAVPAAMGSTPVSLPPEVATPAATEAAVAIPVARAKELKVPAEKSLPLLLPPDYSAKEAFVDLALQKAADLHPELVAGPQVSGFFTVAIVTRANGTLVNSAVRPPAASLDEREAMNQYPQISREVGQMVPKEASQESGIYRKQGTVLPDGRSLRADVRLQMGVLPDSYDMTRSSSAVLETVRKLHSDLLLPATGEETNRLTIFLAEDGSIQREDVQRMSRQNRQPPPFPVREGDPDLPTRMAQYLAQDIASRLKLDVDQIGQINMATLEDGRAAVFSDGTGNLRQEDNRRVLSILYAWPRRPDESAPSLPMGKELNGPTTLQPKFDEAAAVRIIKHEIPDAFTATDRAAGMPAVFLDYKGELIRAARIRAPDGGLPDYFVLVRQLAPGVKMGPGLSREIKDETGAHTTVVFAWEEKPAPVAAK